MKMAICHSLGNLRVIEVSKKLIFLYLDYLFSFNNLFQKVGTETFPNIGKRGNPSMPALTVATVANELFPTREYIWKRDMLPHLKLVYEALSRLSKSLCKRL